MSESKTGIREGRMSLPGDDVPTGGSGGRTLNESSDSLETWRSLRPVLGIFEIFERELNAGTILGLHLRAAIISQLDPQIGPSPWYGKGLKCSRKIHAFRVSFEVRMIVDGGDRRVECAGTSFRLSHQPPSFVPTIARPQITAINVGCYSWSS